MKSEPIQDPCSDGWTVTSAPDAYFYRVRREVPNGHNIEIIDVACDRSVSMLGSPGVSISSYSGRADEVDDDAFMSGSAPPHVVAHVLRAAGWMDDATKREAVNPDEPVVIHFDLPERDALGGNVDHRYRFVALGGKVEIERHGGTDALGVDRWKMTSLANLEWVAPAILTALARGRELGGGSHPTAWFPVLQALGLVASDGRYLSLIDEQLGPDAALRCIQDMRAEGTRMREEIAEVEGLRSATGAALVLAASAPGEIECFDVGDHAIETGVARILRERDAALEKLAACQAEIRKAFKHSIAESQDASHFQCARCRTWAHADNGTDSPAGLCDDCWGDVHHLVDDEWSTTEPGAPTVPGAYRCRHKSQATGGWAKAIVEVHANSDRLVASIGLVCWFVNEVKDWVWGGPWEDNS